MGQDPEALVCDGCGRRYADPSILESGICPSCDGSLVPLEEGPYPD
jgi:hypothetical protein